MDLNAWLKSNTFHHSQFRDLRELVAAKEKAGLTISLCIPTLNEEKTIGKEVVIFRSELMQRYPLIDEIAIIDSGSTDKTLEIAAAFGADTYLAGDILPDVEPKRGKGENLWKAVYQLKGDIIVYIDADIKNIHPRFVYGLVGPLIQRPEVQYVKAFYDRPPRVQPGNPPERRRAGHGDPHPATVLALFPGANGDHPAPLGGVRRPAGGARTDSLSHRLRR
jgi:glucosyl-3-phosphoglycerate synthase